MLGKNSLSSTHPDPNQRRFPTSGLHFMTNVFRKMETAATQKRPGEQPRSPIQGSPAQHHSRSKLTKKSMLLQTKEARVNSCGKHFQSITPNSKSFDIAQKPPSSPELLKNNFLLNQKKLKTLLGKNLLEQKPKTVTSFPDPATQTRPVSKVMPNKASSARTSPQINKIKTPFMAKVVSKEKQTPLPATESSIGGCIYKPYQRSILGDLKQSKGKLFTKLSAKTNKENQKDEENAQNRLPISDIDWTSKPDISKMRQLSQKNCIFANFLGTSQSAETENQKAEPIFNIFNSGFAEKFCPAIFELHCSEITEIRALLAGHGHPLEALIQGFVKSIKHPSFLDISGELRLDNELARSFEFFFKQEIVFVLFLVPMVHSQRLKSTICLTRAFDAICFNLFCFSKILKRHYKQLGKTQTAEVIESIVRTTSLCPLEKTPVKLQELVTENNSFLKSTITAFVEDIRQAQLRRTLAGLLKKAGDSNIFKFASSALEAFMPFFEKFHETTSCEPDAIPRESGARSVSSTSFFYEEEDPYFILQPLKIERYLPDKLEGEKMFTLVLDLDETLVHFTENENNGKFLVRPFAREFLLKLHTHFEIVVFTAALKDYADWILDRIDTGNVIRYRLYRDHTTFQNGVYLKDLSRLNRDLSKTIIVDNNPDNFQMHPENGIYIKSWYEDPNDQALKHLTNVLIKIAESGETDIRRALANLNRRLVASREIADRINGPN